METIAVEKIDVETAPAQQQEALVEAVNGLIEVIAELVEKVHEMERDIAYALED